MSQAQSVDIAARLSKQQVHCPHCFEKFRVSMTRVVARHRALGLDPVAGADPSAPSLRTLPSRFSSRGNPCDPMGEECHQFACPSCHLALTRENLIAAPTFLSLVGAPRAGKTFLLTSAIRTLPQTVARLGGRLSDIAPSENKVLIENGRRLFELSDPETPVDPREILKGTDETHPPNSVRVCIHGETRRQLKPFQFHFERSDPGAEGHEHRAGRVLALYDNPGQDYLTGTEEGRDSSKHLRHSRNIVFVLNPLAEKRLRDRCDQSNPMVRAPSPEELQADHRQEGVLSETIARIAGLKGKSSSGRLDARIVLVVSKSDLYPEMHGLISGRSYMKQTEGSWSFDRDEVDRVSLRARGLLMDAWPEFLERADAADSTRRGATVIPVSMFRPGSIVDETGGRLRIPGSAIEPLWAEVPFLCSFDLSHRSDASNR